MKRFLWAFLALVAAAGIFVAIIGVNDSTVTATGAAAAHRTLEHTIETTGTISASRSQNAAALTNGIVAQVLVDVGDRVQAGDVLVRLEDGGASELMEAAAELEQSALAASAQYAAPDMSELIAAAQMSSVEMSTLDAFQSYAQQTVAVSAGAQGADTQRLTDIVDASEIRAGIAGTVTSVLVSPGSAVVAGTPVARICDLSSLNVVCRVGESDSERVSEGDFVRLTSRATDTIYTGTVSSVSIAASVQTEASLMTGPTVDVTITPSEQFGGKVGMNTDVVIPYSRVEGALCIPVSAMGSDGCVYLLTDDGHAEKRRVTTGMTTDRYIQITSGLEAGDTVLIGSELTDGVKVELI